MKSIGVRESVKSARMQSAGMQSAGMQSGMREPVGKRGEGVLFMVATMVLVLIIACCVAGTVYSRNGISRAEEESFYMEKEQELLRETRSYLSAKGYDNSGVNITRVLNEEGVREYTITIHHGRIDKMEEEKRAELAGELTNLTFSAENCSFSHEFLVLE